MRPSRSAVSTSRRKQRHQGVGLELHVVQHLAHRVALDDGFEDHFVGLAHAYVDRIGVAEQVVQIAQDFLVGAHQERAQVVVVARVTGCSASVRFTSRRSMNWSTLPSESQVMSPSTAWRVGCSFSRWIGMTGNNCLMAQLSGMLWNSEKLQK